MSSPEMTSPPLQPWHQRSRLALRIQILVLVQMLLALFLASTALLFDDALQATIAVGLVLVGVVASLWLYFLRHSRFAEPFVYLNLTVIALLVTISELLSGQIDGSAWILLHAWPPFVLLTVRSPKALYSVIMPISLLILSVIVTLSDQFAIMLLIPAPLLWQYLSYHVIILAISALAFSRLTLAEQKAFQLAVEFSQQLQQELIHAQQLATEKAELNATLEQQIHERTALVEERSRDLARSEERYALAARGASDGLWDWDYRQQVIFFSTRWKAMLGWLESEIAAEPHEWLDRLHPEDRLAFEAIISSQHLAKQEHFELEYRIRHRDGSYRWMLCRGLSVSDANGILLRLVGSQTDITERKQAEDRLRHYALHDALTGLPNRFAFLDQLEALLATAQSADTPFAVLFLDLDRFKHVNDSLGHLWGDELLVQVAHRLRDCLGHEALLARMGGDEFAVLLIGPSAETEALVIAHTLIDTLRQPFVLRQQEVFSNVSIGIALSTFGYLHPDDLLRDADAAMYVAKIERQGVVVFDAAMHAHAMVRLQIENDLHRALERNEFQLVYQPIVTLANQQVQSFEALVRWHHGKHGIISPERFIPIAEDVGLIIAIGDWVLNEACRQLAAWQQDYPKAAPCSVSVNLSPRQIQPRLVEQVIKALETHQLEPQQLRLEIVESGLISEGEAAVVVCQHLRKLGVRISIDDFGTGYSSLSYLYRFPVDTLKIDRSFISHLRLGDDHHKIITAIVRLGSSLGLDVVAEGIETAEQLAILKALNCGYGQGWLFARALTPAEATEFIQRQMLSERAFAN